MFFCFYALQQKLLLGNDFMGSFSGETMNNPRRESLNLSTEQRHPKAAVLPSELTQQGKSSGDPKLWSTQIFPPGNALGCLHQREQEPLCKGFSVWFKVSHVFCTASATIPQWRHHCWDPPGWDLQVQVKPEFTVSIRGLVVLVPL